MSITSRVISGSLASWLTIGINLVSQLFIIPIYLTYWDIKTYGFWIAIQGLFALLTTVEKSHINFLGFEFLRIANSSRDTLGTCILSGISYGIIIDITQLILTLLIIYTGFFSFCLGKGNMIIISQASMLLVLLMISSLLYVSVGGILIRALSALNYYPRMAWWGVLHSFYNLIVPAIVVSQGGNLISVGLAIVISTLIFSIFAFTDMVNLLKKEGIIFQTTSWRLGLNNFKKSLAIAGKDFLDSFRQQGLRVILAPLTGTTSLVAFFTMRTGANVALQGLNMIVYPLLPELSKFLHQRSQTYLEAAFGTVWIVTIGLLAPGVVLLQLVIAPLFSIWTRHQVYFDPLLFAFLSLSVLVYAVSQPGTAVVTTNNLLTTQLILSLITSVIILFGIWYLVPRIGIIGAAISLLVAEIVSAVGYKIVAQKWLNEHKLQWPSNAFKRAIVSIVISMVSMLLIVSVPAVKWVTACIATVLFIINFQHYWKLLPEFAIQRARNFSKIFLFTK